MIEGYRNYLELLVFRNLRTINATNPAIIPRAIDSTGKPGMLVVGAVVLLALVRALVSVVVLSDSSVVV
jgi:hypothetical protein